MLGEGARTHVPDGNTTRGCALGGFELCNFMSMQHERKLFLHIVHRIWLPAHLPFYECRKTGNRDDDKTTVKQLRPQYIIKS